MRIAVLVVLVACSNPAAPKPESGASTTAIDPASLPAVDGAALRPPPGARLVIGLSPSIAAAALSPTGDVLAVGANGESLQLVHVPTARMIAVRSDLGCTNPEFSARCEPELAFSRDGRRLAAYWSHSKKLVVLGVPGAKTELEATLEDVSSLAFLEDGRLVALRNGTSDVFDRAGVRRDFFVSEGRVVAVSPDGRFVAVDNDGVHIHDVASKKIVGTPPGKIDDVRFGRDATTWVGELAAAGGDAIVTWRAGDAAPRTLIAEKPATATTPTDSIGGFTWPPPYDRVYVGLDSGLVAITLDGAEQLRSPWVRGNRIAGDSVARTGDSLVALARNRALQLDARGNLAPGPSLCAMRPAMLAFDPTGTKLYSSPWHVFGVVTYSTQTGHILRAESHAEGTPPPGNGATLAAVAADPELRKRIESVFTLPGVARGAYVLSRDHARVFIGNADRGPSIVELATKRVRANLQHFLVSADGSHIAIRRKDDEQRIDIRTVDGDRLVRTLPTPTILVDYMALSGDGKVFATGTLSSTTVYDVGSGKALFEAPCGNAYTGHLELSADGRLLACDTRAGVEVYDVRKRQLVKRVEHPHDENADTFALSPDGRQLAIGAGTIVLVDL